MYALSLDENNRIISICTVLKFTPEYLPRVDALPNGDYNNYLYIDGEYIYSPLPNEEPNNQDNEYIPTQEDDIMAMLIDQEYRITLLELGLK